MIHVLYLHGFLSSPKSVKAQATKAYFDEHHPDVRLYIPELSNYPSKVEAQLLMLIEQNPHSHLISAPQTLTSILSSSISLD